MLLASLLLLCACQPTPESSIIVGKDQQQMIEKAQEDEFCQGGFQTLANLLLFISRCFILVDKLRKIKSYHSK